MLSLEIFFIDINIPAALWPWGWLTQPLIEMSTRNIFWGGKGGRCVWLTTLPPSYAHCLEIWEPYSPGTLKACPGLKCDSFYHSTGTHKIIARIVKYRRTDRHTE